MGPKVKATLPRHVKRTEGRTFGLVACLRVWREANPEPRYGFAFAYKLTDFLLGGFRGSAES